MAQIQSFDMQECPDAAGVRPGDAMYVHPVVLSDGDEIENGTFGFSTGEWNEDDRTFHGADVRVGCWELVIVVGTPVRRRPQFPGVVPGPERTADSVPVVCHSSGGRVAWVPLGRLRHV